MSRTRMRNKLISDSHTSDDAAPLLVTPAAAFTGRSMMPSEGGGGSGNIYPDSNTVIVLAVLLCVLIGALGFNSLVRCARHRTLDAVAEPSAAATAIVVVAAAPAAASHSSGLDKKELRKIPVVEYETSKALPGTECAICLGEFVDGEKVRLLPRCHHGFHVRCKDRWLATHSSCPICRNSLLVKEEDRHGDGEEVSMPEEAT